VASSYWQNFTDLRSHYHNKTLRQDYRSIKEEEENEKKLPYPWAVTVCVVGRLAGLLAKSAWPSAYQVPRDIFIVLYSPRTSKEICFRHSLSLILKI
jgi:hypothetical protein